MTTPKHTALQKKQNKPPIWKALAKWRHDHTPSQLVTRLVVLMTAAISRKKERPPKCPVHHKVCHAAYQPKQVAPPAASSLQQKESASTSAVQSQEIIAMMSSFQTKVLIKLDIIIDNQQEQLKLLNATRPSTTAEDLNILPSPLVSVADLKLLCKRISTVENFRKQLRPAADATKRPKSLCETESGECLKHAPFKDGGNKCRSKTTAPEIMERDGSLSTSPRDRRSTSTESTLMLFD
ncbi:hypothetical protein J4Q44_G00104010 [Coregonus suidteri]|uniref:Uncharacterized protein n=1 Tax=Coregonus suidteri TaxID=861788 RepID=A0AAN8QWF4_9TELE